jgi:hypothetical protein
MKTFTKTLAGVICGMGLLTLPTMAQKEKESEYSLSDFKLGTQVSGDTVKLDELEGKVVVIDYWGTR